MNKSFYVYVHFHANGVPFYVGKGHAGRAFSIKGRSEEWRFNAENGYKVRIAASGLSEKCAYSIEKILINLIGRGSLCNKTAGGSGTSGSIKSEEFKALRTGSKNPNFDTNIYRFYHITHGSEECTRYDLCNKYGLKTVPLGQVILGKRSHTGGWHMAGSVPNFQKGLQHPAVDKTIYSFVHAEHGERSCTRYELTQEFRLNVSNLKSMIRGVNRSCKGWRLA